MRRSRPTSPNTRGSRGRSRRASCWATSPEFTASAVTTTTTCPAAIARISTKRSRPSPTNRCSFEPGTNYRFSTYGWILLSAVVEGASGEPFPTFMRREVFERARHGSHGARGDRQRPRHRVVLLSEDDHGRQPRRAGRAGGGLLLSCGRGRISLHAVRPGAPRVCDAEARAVEGGNHRAVPDAAPARVRRFHWIRAGLEGRQRPAWRCAGAGAASSRPVSSVAPSHSRSFRIAVW